jgi:kinesin family protein 6/9
MPSASIKTVLRCRPSARASAAVRLDIDERQVHFELDKAKNASNIVDNTKTYFPFQFDTLFGMEAKQDEIFELVAKPVVDDVLRGVNGTIFAYGQTGSGKTYTITGGTERYVDRGIIPRTLSYVFEQIKSRQDAQYKVYISYLELYS